MLRLLAILLVAFTSYAQNLEIKDLRYRVNDVTNSATIYVTLVNHSYELVEIEDFKISSPKGKDVILEQSFVDDQGISKIVQIDNLYIPEGSSVSLKPGGIHLLVKDVAEGVDDDYLLIYPKNMSSIKIPLKNSH